MRRIKEYAAFLKEFPRTFQTTGAISPSSRGLALELTRDLRGRSEPARILEVGPGTGAVTTELVRTIIPGDHVELVELNDRFIEILQHRFQNEKHFHRVCEQVKLLHKSVEQMDPRHKFDFVICGLPFNNFPTSLVRRIFRHMWKLVRPGGRLAFFEYLWIRRVKSLASRPTERKRLEGVGMILQRYLDHFEEDREIIWTNIPPTVVHHLVSPPTGKSTRTRKSRAVQRQQRGTRAPRRQRGSRA